MSHKKKKHQKRMMNAKEPKPLIKSRNALKEEPDVNIFAALNLLPKRMQDRSGNSIVIPLGDKGNQILSHIAAKRHKLRVIDIEALPSLLLSAKARVIDERKSVIYLVQRPGSATLSEQYLRIVTLKKGGLECILKTIYPTKK